MTRNALTVDRRRFTQALQCDQCGGYDRREFSAGELAPAACRCSGGPL